MSEATTAGATVTYTDNLGKQVTKEVKPTEAHESFQRWLAAGGLTIPVDHVAAAIVLHGEWQGSKGRSAERKALREQRYANEKAAREQSRIDADKKRAEADQARADKQAEADKKRQDREAEQEKKRQKREQEKADKAAKAEADKAAKAAEKAAKDAEAASSGADGDDSGSAPVDGQPVGRGALQEAKREGRNLKRRSPVGQSAGNFG